VKKNKSRKGRSQAEYNRLGLLVITFVVLLFLGSMLQNSRRLETRLASYNARAEALKEKLEEEKARTEEIDALKEYMKTDEYAEEVAREKLGLVKYGEIVFREGSSREE